MTEEHILGYEILEEENNSLLVAEGYNKKSCRSNSFKMGSIDKALPSRGILPG